MPAVTADGVNVLAVFDAVSHAARRARDGGGPTFIEVPVYRFRAHGGAGDDSRTGYRDEAERAAWESIDPILLFAGQLKSSSLLTDRGIEAMEHEIAGEIAEAFDFALASPMPSEEDLYKHVYAE